MSVAWKTAITRKGLSKPARWLMNNGKIIGRLLDYGCGRGGDMARFNCEGYDPHWAPGEVSGPFRTIMCNYVLNVIESDEERRAVLRKIDDLLDDNGTAYIAVRNNRKDLRGKTRTGTWQGLVELSLRIVYKDSDTVIYEMWKGESDCEMVAKIF